MAEPVPIECKLSIASEAAMDVPLLLGFELRNPGKHPLWVLDWNTPLEGLRNHYLSIKGPAGELDYHGPMVKRAAPLARQYRQLKPGERLYGEVDLKLAYQFVQPGSYEVAFTGRLHDVQHGKHPRPDKVERQPQEPACAPVRFKLLPR
ncbi:hypothetical protein [Chitinimonas sp.]|uniref:hypothetical protein n=1 Tax=Chitinimonas sp. TaxID=1934313 RepID=UPI0035AF6E2D